MRGDAPSDRPHRGHASAHGRSILKALTIPLLFVLVVAGWATGRGAYALYTATTAHSDSTLATGTVVLSDDDAGVAVVSLIVAQPGDSSTGCINISYDGSLDAGMRLYAGASGGLGTYVTLVVTRGALAAPSFNSCASFTADAQNYIGAGSGVIYSGLLSAYPATWTAGIVDPTASAPSTWHTGQAHAYQVQVTLNNDSGAQGLTDSVTFTWEATSL